MKVYGYYRVSGRSQVDGDGFPRQRAAVQAWAAVNGAEIVEEFEEEGVGGDNEWDQRPAFASMMDKILGNGVRTIVVENLGRLARAYVVQEHILIWLASKDVALIAADSGEDITAAIKGDPIKKLVIQLQGAIYEYEKNSLVRKLKAARQRKKEATGRCGGRYPFGHRPGEKETIARMKELRASRPRPLSYLKIATALDEEGLPSRTGKPWTGEAVRLILNREITP